jgi:hypothetical protein
VKLYLAAVVADPTGWLLQFSNGDLMKKNLFTLLFILTPHFALAGGLFGGNMLDDTFPVKKIEGKEATAEGAPKDLKAGNYLYFARSPFKFKVTAVTGNQVTIALPEKHDLAVGNTLVRKETDAMKKAIDTEGRLKQALDE